MKLAPSSTLNTLATRYVWWKKPEWAYQHPNIFLSNIMNLGNFNDIQLLRHEVGDAALKTVLQHAPAGCFNYRSWDYWHLKLGINPIPPLPTRQDLI